MEKAQSIKIEYGVQGSATFSKLFSIPENYERLADSQSDFSLSCLAGENGKYIACLICTFDMTYQNNRFDRITTFFQNALFSDGQTPIINECQINTTCIIKKIILYTNEV